MLSLRIPLSLIAALVFLLPPRASGQVYRPLSAGAEQTINTDWTFQYFPSTRIAPEVAAPSYDDRSWPAVAVPHTWSTFETTREVHPFIRNAAERDDPYWWYGWGWYRKRFELGSDLKGKKVFVEFDGVQKYSRVYLNGRFIGEHKGGYTSFSFDLTDHVRFGAENVLAVAVSNRRDDLFGGIPPMTAGNFDVYGGIYRDVRLVIKEDLYIPFQGSADYEGGTFVTTPEVSDERGIVYVKTFVRNDGRTPRKARLRTVIVDADRRILDQMETEASIEPDATHRFDQTSEPVSRPRLWSPQDPYVYRVHTELYTDGRLVDAYESPLGFRWFHWDHETDALYLNGEPVHIHGTNRHQEYPWLGDAIPKWLHAKELDQIRNDLGMNFLRATHYPNDPILYHLADSLGIIMVEEVPNIKSIDFGEDIQEQNVREMVRRDRNHPSILFWSIGNETNDPADGRWVWEEDTTRIVHLRHGPKGDPYVQHTHDDLEMENQLRVTIRGWYDVDEKDARPENGQHASTEEWQHFRMRSHENNRARIDEDLVHWLYADHGADREYTNAPLKHINPKGWIDLYRFPKYGYYLWKANWSAEPVLFIHPHYWRMPYVGQSRDIIVDSNADYVELFVNGRSMGRKTPDRSNFYTVTFKNVPIERGALIAEGPRRGVMLRDTVVMAGPPARLVLSASPAEIPADRSGISMISVDIVDAAGVHVYGADNPLTWSVEGPGKLVGPELYESDRNKHEAMEGVMYIDTPVQNLVRSTSEPGVIRVRVTSPGLAPAEIALRSTPPGRPVASGIRLPSLSDSGRRPVRRDASYRPGHDLTGVEQIRPAADPLVVAGRTPSAVRSEIRSFIRQRNPEVDTTTAAYRALETRLAETLTASGGRMIEDDFNFLAGRYNEAIRLSRYLEAVRLHVFFRDALMRYYADEIIGQGAPLTLDSERQRLEPLFGGSRVVFLEGSTREGFSSTPVLVTDDGKGGVFSHEHRLDYYIAKAGSLEQLLSLAYPEFAALPAEQKQRIYRYMDELNPAIRYRDGAFRMDSYEPVILPPIDVLRSR